MTRRTITRKDAEGYVKLVEDKVWSGTVFAPGGNNGQEELP
jgi:hypothetical protein